MSILLWYTVFEGKVARVFHLFLITLAWRVLGVEWTTHWLSSTVTGNPLLQHLHITNLWRSTDNDNGSDAKALNGSLHLKHTQSRWRKSGSPTSDRTSVDELAVVVFAGRSALHTSWPNDFNIPNSVTGRHYAIAQSTGSAVAVSC